MNAKCPKCAGTSFAMEEIRPEHSNYKYNTIQCKACGTLICVVEAFNISTTLHVEMKKMEATIGSMAAEIGTLREMIQRLYQKR